MIAKICGQGEVPEHDEVILEAKVQTCFSAFWELGPPLHGAVMEVWPHLLLEGWEEVLDLALNLLWDAYRIQS